jgi:hypothetical protein
MEFVYLLWYTHIDESLDGGEDFKLIGVYTSMELAEAAQARSELLERFKDAKDGFEISRCQLDKDGWTSGYITITH